MGEPVASPLPVSSATSKHTVTRELHPRCPGINKNTSYTRAARNTLPSRPKTRKSEELQGGESSLYGSEPIMYNRVLHFYLLLPLLFRLFHFLFVLILSFLLEHRCGVVAGVLDQKALSPLSPSFVPCPSLTSSTTLPTWNVCANPPSLQLRYISTSKKEGNSMLAHVGSINFAPNSSSSGSSSSENPFTEKPYRIANGQAVGTA